MNMIRCFLLFLGKKQTVLKIFVIGLVLRLGLSLFLGERLLPLADQPVFLDMAEHIAAGHGIMISEEMVGIPDSVPDSIKAVLMTRPERIRDQELEGQAVNALHDEQQLLLRTVVG